jgi:hypothetical protein
MKNRVKATFTAVALMLTMTSVVHAKSEFVSLSCAPLWPTSSTPATNLLYYVTAVGRAGAGLLEVTLTASDMPPGLAVTFSPPVLRFTGNQLTSQTATMAVQCSSPMPLDCYAFTMTGTSAHGNITITNVVMFTPDYVASRPATLFVDNLGNNNLRLRGLGATAKTYQIQGKAFLSDSTWMPLGNSTADGNGRFTFFPAPATEAPSCVFRALEFHP